MERDSAGRFTPDSSWTRKPSPPGTRKLLGSGYVRIKVEGKREWQLEHRVVWEREHGPLPPGACIHHINHNRADNRLENLEFCQSISAHRRKHRSPMLGRRWTPEQIERMRETGRRVTADPAVRARLSEIGKLGAARRWGSRTS